MGQAQPYPERIRRIKARKETMRISYQDIVDRVFENGEITSLGTVKKVFSLGSEEKNFKDITLLPIERVLGLLDEEEEAPLSPGTEKFYQDIIREQNESIKHNTSLLMIKNFFLAVLIAYEAVKVIYDRIYLDAGWFTPENPVGWFFSVGFLVVFILAYIVMSLYTRKKKE